MGSMVPDISVIVPIYNVEEYLAECLDSLASQTKSNIEVLLINDGSPDGSGEIAQAYTRKYDNFFYFEKESGGPGSARNYGVERARGTYIAFVDSDDVVLPEMYELLYKAVERNDSDMAICNVARVDSTGVSDSPLHCRAFRNVKSCTSIYETPQFVYDSTTWNKLIKRSFYLENGFSFPEGVLYEDIPVAMRLHLLANNVSVVRSICYLWRLRDGAQKSITQRTTEIRNLRDRICGLRIIDNILRERNAGKELLRAWDVKKLEIDFMVFINKVNCIEDSVAQDYMKETREYVNENVDLAAMEELSLSNQAKLRYLLADDLPHLREVRDFEETQYRNLAVASVGDDLMVDLPEELFGFSKASVKKELSKRLVGMDIENVTLTGGVLEVTAHIYRKRLETPEGFEWVRASLVSEASYERMPMKVETCYSNALKNKGVIFDTSTGRAVEYDYGPSAFTATIDLNEVSLRSDVVYRVVVEYKNKYASGSEMVRQVGNVRDGKFTRRYLVDSDCYEASLTPAGDFCLRYSRNVPIVKKTSKKEDRIVFKLSAPVKALVATSGPSVAKLWNAEENAYALNISDLEFGKPYTLQEEQEPGVLVPLLRRKRDSQLFNFGPSLVMLTVKSRQVELVRLVCASTVSEVSFEEGEFALVTLPKGDFRHRRLVKRAELYMEDPMSAGHKLLARAEARKPFSRDVFCFKVNFADEAQHKNLYLGKRKLSVKYNYLNGMTVEMPLVMADRFNRNFDVDGIRINVARDSQGFMTLASKKMWPENLKLSAYRKQEIAQLYPQFMKEPIDEKLIVFESTWATKYNCNPRALYEYIDKNLPEYKCVWALKDEHTPIEGRATRVRYGSAEYWYVLATAKYLVNNVNFPNGYIKRPGQIELQTMHGTPLKSFGLDVPGEHESLRDREEFIKRNRRWDYLLVQGKFMESDAQRMLACDCEILTLGYPRTDQMLKVTDKDRAALRKKLGLPADKKVILYAPTYRVRSRFDMQLDLPTMKEALGDEYVLAIRVHYFVTKVYSVPADGEFVFDMNDYSSIEDLYAVADVVITDYSSLMFDFALLRKPMLFYVYDFEEYSENLRGMYVDLREEAPGPLLYTSEEVIEALKHLDETTGKYREAAEKFREKFLTYERDDSCEQVARALLGKQE